MKWKRQPSGAWCQHRFCCGKMSLHSTDGEKQHFMVQSYTSSLFKLLFICKCVCLYQFSFLKGKRQVQKQDSLLLNPVPCCQIQTLTGLEFDQNKSLIFVDVHYLSPSTSPFIFYFEHPLLAFRYQHLPVTGCCGSLLAHRTLRLRHKQLLLIGWTSTGGLFIAVGQHTEDRPAGTGREMIKLERVEQFLALVVLKIMLNSTM